MIEKAKTIEDEVIGYILDFEGNYDKKYYFKGSIENMTKFILQNSISDTTITTTGDELICKSIMGGYLDVCTDKTILNELLAELKELQEGKQLTIIKFKEIERGVMKEIE